MRSWEVRSSLRVCGLGGSEVSGSVKGNRSYHHTYTWTNEPGTGQLISCETAGVLEVNKQRVARGLPGR